MKHSVSSDYDRVHQFNLSPFENNRNSSKVYSSQGVIDFIDSESEKCDEIISDLFEDEE